MHLHDIINLNQQENEKLKQPSQFKKSSEHQSYFAMGLYIKKLNESTSTAQIVFLSSKKKFKYWNNHRIWLNNTIQVQ